MVFTPRGIDTKPANLKELFGAIGDVLAALVMLHDASWMHRDIRWANVMRRRNGSNSWFLIDYMNVEQSPAVSSSEEHLRPGSHAPEIHDTNVKHTTAVDSWSVGYLLRGMDKLWGDGGERTAFRKALMKEDPSQRPTAMDALQKLEELKKISFPQKRALEE
ncbi:Pyrrolidone-carboxylate peptidase [Phytophthora nicotianae]|nr:Pyrrolidone-carboxylate peptidase [Phytophthora nicotianae]